MDLRRKDQPDQGLNDVLPDDHRADQRTQDENRDRQQAAERFAPNKADARDHRRRAGKSRSQKR